MSVIKITPCLVTGYRVSGLNCLGKRVSSYRVTERIPSMNFNIISPISVAMISGIDMADNAYTPEAVTNADGEETGETVPAYTADVIQAWKAGNGTDDDKGNLYGGDGA